MVPLGYPTYTGRVLFRGVGVGQSQLSGFAKLGCVVFEIKGVFLPWKEVGSWQAMLQVANLPWQPCYPHPLQCTQKGAETEDAWRKYILLSQRLVLIISSDVTIANKLDASSFYFLHSSWNRL